MENSIKQILSELISLSIQGDCEMFNMGDWSSEDLTKALFEKENLIDNLKDPSFDLKNVPHKFYYEAIHDLALYMRTFGPDDKDMHVMQDVERAIALHIWRNFRS